MSNKGAEIITDNSAENMVDIQREVTLIVDRIEQNAQEDQEEAQSLEMELRLAEVASNEGKEAKIRGQETADKIGALA